MSALEWFWRTQTKGSFIMFANANRAFAALASVALTIVVMATAIIPASPALMV